MRIESFAEKFLDRPVRQAHHQPEDVRVGDLLRHAMVPATGLRQAIIGFPVDIGVRINGGRVGAAEGPDALRPCLYSMTPDALYHEQHCDILRSTADLGNLAVPGGSLERAQELLGEVVAACLLDGITPIVLGGGHEMAYGVFLGYAMAGMKVDIVNVDAHLDVRELKNGAGHSGSPFRQALEHPGRHCASYTVTGLQVHSVSRTDLDYARGRAARLTWREDFNMEELSRAYQGTGRAVMATMDMDALDQICAPGVSAPAVGGLSADTACLSARRAGASAAVRSFDLAELNPRHDVEQLTARLAARVLWSFLRGLADRPVR